MINPLQLLRLLRINYILLKYGLVRPVVSRSALLRRFSYLNPWSFQRNLPPRGASIRIGLEKLGPIFIKFGQILSTRRDLLAEDIADELAKLQDQVPAFSGEKAKLIIESELKKPIATIFNRFDIQPLASASIAQVHAAELHDGSDVIIKVLRPDIHKTIRHDIALMYLAARVVKKFLRCGHRLKPVELVKEFEQTLFNEMDLSREAANAAQLKRNFQNSRLMYVPTVHWPLVTPRVMVMERIYGVRISDLASLHKAKVNLKKLAEHGVEIFFTQVLRDSFFHADMHPGNLFVDINDPENPKYLGIDFGIMGSLSAEDQHYLAANLLAFFKRDYRRVATLHVECGWVPAETRVDQFESAMRTVCEPIFERPLKDISFGKLLLTLFRIAEQFNMSIQPQLILLQKTLLNIEGLGRQLYPELDLWHTAKPFLEQWMKKQHSPLSVIKQGITELPQIAEKLLRTPELFYQFLQRKQNQSSTHTSSVIPEKNGSFFTGTGFAFSIATIACYVTAAPSFWTWGAGILAATSFFIKTQIRI